MTNSIDIRNNQILYFRKWSHKSYAIFNSIGRVVRISFLSTILPGLIAVKSSVLHHLHELLDVFCLDDDLKVEEIPENLILAEFDIPPHLSLCETKTKDDFNQNCRVKYFSSIVLRPFFGPFFIVLDSFDDDGLKPSILNWYKS